MNKYPERDRDVAKAIFGGLMIVAGLLLVIAAGGRVNGGIVIGIPLSAVGIFLFTYGMSGLTDRRDDDELSE